MISFLYKDDPLRSELIQHRIRELTDMERMHLCVAAKKHVLPLRPRLYKREVNVDAFKFFLPREEKQFAVECLCTPEMYIYFTDKYQIKVIIVNPEYRS